MMGVCKIVTASGGSSLYLTLPSVLIWNQHVGDGDKSRIIKVMQKNYNNVLKQTWAQKDSSLTSAWWVPGAPGPAPLLSLDCWSLQSCSPWRCTSRPRPSCDCRTLHICKRLRGWNRNIHSEWWEFIRKSLEAHSQYGWEMLSCFYLTFCSALPEGWWSDRNWPHGCF